MGNTNTVMTTGAVGFTATQLTEIMQWLAPTMPISVAASISVLLMTLFHTAYILGNRYISAKAVTQEAPNA